MKAGRVWNTEAVEEILNRHMTTGVMAKQNPFKDGNKKYKEADIPWEYSEWEYKEKLKIFADKMYFAENYAKVMTDFGIKKIKLRKYQRKNLSDLDKHRMAIWCASRQIGKSITMAIDIAHYIITNKDRNVVLLSKTGDKVKDLLNKIMVILEELPFFLKPGIVTKNVMTKFFDNGCSIQALTTTEDSGASFTAHYLYIDEFALIDNNFLDQFWYTAVPTLSSSQISRCVLTSTPRGLNKFWEIYKGAMDGKNSFHPMINYWWEVPTKIDEVTGEELEYRGEAWKKEQIEDLTSEEAFNQEYGCQFLAGDQLLLKSEELRRVKAGQQEFVAREIPEFMDMYEEYDWIKWHPKFNMAALKNEKSKFSLIVDLGGGDGGDYSVINIMQLLPMSRKEIEELPYASDDKDFFKMVQIGLVRSNTIPIPEFAKIFYHLVVDVMSQENVKVVLETNYDGNWFISEVVKLYGDDNEIDEESLFVQFLHRIDAKKKKTGIKMNEGIKDNSVKMLKDRLRYRQIIPVDKITVGEVLTFAKNDNGKYKAQSGNDDVVMCLVACAKFMSTPDYTEMLEEMLEGISKEFTDLIKIKLHSAAGSELNDDSEEDEEDDMFREEKKKINKEVNDLLDLL